MFRSMPKCKAIAFICIGALVDPPIAELRTIAGQIGVDNDKLTTRKVICAELHKILNIEKIVQEKKEKKLKVWKCEDYTTNRGKKCPNCCSYHKDTCKWVRGKGCKTKK